MFIIKFHRAAVKTVIFYFCGFHESCVLFILYQYLNQAVEYFSRITNEFRSQKTKGNKTNHSLQSLLDNCALKIKRTAN